MDFANGFARLLIRCDENEFDVRVEEENTKQLRATVTGAAEDTDSDFVRERHCLKSVLEQDYRIFRINLACGYSVHDDLEERAAFTPCVCRRHVELRLDVVLAHLRIRHRSGDHVNLDTAPS